MQYVNTWPTDHIILEQKHLTTVKILQLNTIKQRKSFTHTQWNKVKTKNIHDITRQQNITNVRRQLTNLCVNAHDTTCHQHPCLCESCRHHTALVLQVSTNHPYTSLCYSTHYVPGTRYHITKSVSSYSLVTQRHRSLFRFSAKYVKHIFPYMI